MRKSCNITRQNTDLRTRGMLWAENRRGLEKKTVWTLLVKKVNALTWFFFSLPVCCETCREPDGRAGEDLPTSRQPETLVWCLHAHAQTSTPSHTRIRTHARTFNGLLCLTTRRLAVRESAAITKMLASSIAPHITSILVKGKQVTGPARKCGLCMLAVSGLLTAGLKG